MSKHILQNALMALSLIVFMASCDGQPKTAQVHGTDSAKTPAIPAWADKNIAPEKDPYFNGTTTITSSYGPQTITRNVLQDRNGTIWLATWDGIIQYDGKAFTNITNKEGLRRFRIFSMLEDRKGDIWFGSIGAGVYRFDGKTFTNITIADGLVNDRIGCITQDTKGNIWFGTQKGVTCYNGSTYRNFTTANGLVNDDVNAIAEDKDGKIWIATRNGICYYDGTSFSAALGTGGNLFTNTRALIKDKNDNIWFGGQEGLWKYDGTNFTNFSTNFIGNIYEDKNGTIWFSSGTPRPEAMALYRLDQPALPLVNTTAVLITKEKDQVYGITEDAAGNIWFGRSSGITCFDGNSLNYFIKK